jgi:serpin B
MQPVDASRQINSWVAEATNNLIESIVGPDSVSKDTQLVVTNALYFKGRWETPFHKSKTMDHEFHRMDGSAIDAQFMSSDKDQFIAVHDGFKVLKMPYETMLQDPVHGRPPRSYSMFVFLPDARDGLWSLEDRIASSPGFISDHLPKKPVAIGEFRVPKFKLSFPASIAKVLQNLGITTVFTPGAELPGMLENNGGPLFVSDVMHKAVIEVNEEGTEAAACTGIFMVGSSRPAPKPPVLVDFVADHPFAFCLVEEVSGAILFTGHVLDPTRS